MSKLCGNASGTGSEVGRENRDLMTEVYVGIDGQPVKAFQPIIMNLKDFTLFTAMQACQNV
jgi:hypothetical protein